VDQAAICTTFPTLFLAAVELFLPGYAWILISGLHDRLRSYERVAISFVLSVCFSSLLSAALSVVTSNYLFLSAAICLVTAVLAVGWHYYKARLALWRGKKIALSTGSRVLDLTIIAYAILVLAAFWTAPYYPAVAAPDLLTHFRVTNMIVEGEGKSVFLSANFPTGLHFTAALFSSLSQIGAFQSLRVITALTLLAIVPLTYSSARELIGSSAASMALLVAAFAMPVDAVHFLQPLFPNLMADAVVLSSLLLVFRYLKQPSSTIGVTLGLLGIGGVFMHSSFLLYVAVLLLALPVAALFFKEQTRNYWRAVTYSTVGLVLFGVFAWFSLHGNLQRVSSGYILGVSSVDLRSFPELISSSLLTYMGPVNAVAVVCAVAFAKYRNSFGRTFLILWLIALIPGAFLSGQAYRFVLFAMLPGSFLVGNMLAGAPSLLSTANNVFLSRLKRAVVVVIFLLLVLSGAFLGPVMQGYNPAGRARQISLYDSMVWLERGGCSSGVASVGLWPDYMYLPTLTGVPYMGDFVRSPDYVLQKSQSLGFHCLVVAKSNQYFQQYENDTALVDKYQNELVTVFAIT
jgi:hypothetical protein